MVTSKASAFLVVALVFAARFAARVVYEETTTAAVAQEDQYDCARFGSQESAQATYDADPTDPNNLDPDDDGMACEDYDYGVEGESPTASPQPERDAGGDRPRAARCPTRAASPGVRCLWAPTARAPRSSRWSTAASAWLAEARPSLAQESSKSSPFEGCAAPVPLWPERLPTRQESGLPLSLLTMAVGPT